jgi:RimJ/RimL family protein N-acetyltransferase
LGMAIKKWCAEGMGMLMEVIFRADTLRIGRITDKDLDSSLEVYKRSEDFLSLGPVPTASMEMLLADINHSESVQGLFCGIWDESGNQVGVVDFIPDSQHEKAILELLMISKEYRNKGIGSTIVRHLELYLKQTYGTKTIESGVQTNNEGGIRFWKRHGYHLDEIGKPMGDGTVAYQMRKEIA